MGNESVLVEITEVPKSVRQGVSAIWVALLICALGALYGKLNGSYSAEEFVVVSIIYALFCIIPYKISGGSNAARYVYAIIFALAILFTLGGIGEWKRIDLLVSIIATPIEAFALYKLFHRESAEWFESKRLARR